MRGDGFTESTLRSQLGLLKTRTSEKLRVLHVVERPDGAECLDCGLICPDLDSLLGAIDGFLAGFSATKVLPASSADRWMELARCGEPTGSMLIHPLTGQPLHVVIHRMGG